MLLYESGEYRATKNWPYAISAGCVVYRKSTSAGVEVLLLKRSTEHSHNSLGVESYNLPKGHVGLHETLEQAAVRETQEEAGCEIEVKTYLGSKIREFSHPKFKINNNKTIHYFAAQWLSDLDSMDSEHDDKVWIALTEALKLLGKPNVKGEDEIVKRLYKFLELSDG